MFDPRTSREIRSSAVLCISVLLIGCAKQVDGPGADARIQPAHTLTFRWAPSTLHADTGGFRYDVGPDDPGRKFGLRFYFLHTFAAAMEVERSWVFASAGGSIRVDFDTMDFAGKMIATGTNADYPAEPKEARIWRLQPDGAVWANEFRFKKMFDRETGKLLDLFYADRACRITLPKEDCTPDSFKVDIAGPGVYAVSRNADRPQSRDTVYTPPEILTLIDDSNGWRMNRMIESRHYCEDPVALKPKILGTWWSADPGRTELDRAVFRVDDSLQLSYEDTAGVRSETVTAYLPESFQIQVDPPNSGWSLDTRYLPSRLSLAGDTLFLISNPYVRRPERPDSAWLPPNP